MIIVPFEKWHLGILELQVAQQNAPLEEGHGDMLEKAGNAWSMIDESGICIISAGIIDMGFSRGQGWALVSKQAAPHLARITKEIRKRIDTFNFNRIEIVVNRDFKEGHRWAKMLGFKCETPEGMEEFMPNINCYLYRRIRWQTR